MKRIKWSDQELFELNNICESGWDWEFPGYSWVAEQLNDQFYNERSASSCRYWDKKISSEAFKERWKEIVKNAEFL